MGECCFMCTCMPGKDRIINGRRICYVRRVSIWLRLYMTETYICTVSSNYLLLCIQTENPLIFLYFWTSHRLLGPSVWTWHSTLPWQLGENIMGKHWQPGRIRRKRLSFSIDCKWKCCHRGLLSRVSLLFYNKSGTMSKVKYWIKIRM